MSFDTPGWPLVDDFFLEEALGRAPGTVRRYARVRDRLTAFLDQADMAPFVGTDPASVLDAERDFHTSGAFWVLYGPDELVCCLPGLVVEPWLPSGRSEARTQISLVDRLLRHLKRHRLLDLQRVMCAYWDTEAAIAGARRELAARPREPDARSREVPARLRQPPGPQW